MDKEKSIEVLNALVQIHNDRIAGYQHAIKETDEPDLKTMFSQFAQMSQRYKHELIHEVHKLSGIAIEKNQRSGKIFKAWTDVKLALASKDRKAILIACEIGEDLAVDTYKKELKMNDDELSTEVQTLLVEQFFSLKADQHKVKAMREFLVAVN